MLLLKNVADNITEPDEKNKFIDTFTVTDNDYDLNNLLKDIVKVDDVKDTIKEPVIQSVKKNPNQTPAIQNKNLAQTPKLKSSLRGIKEGIFNGRRLFAYGSRPRRSYNKKRGPRKNIGRYRSRNRKKKRRTSINVKKKKRRRRSRTPKKKKNARRRSFKKNS